MTSPTLDMEQLANVAAERAFLGGLLLIGQPPRAKLLLEQLLVTPDRLVDPSHQLLLRAILAHGADQVLLHAKLAHDPAYKAAGGATWLSDLLSGAAVEAQLPAFASEIRDMALRRKLEQIARDLLARAHDAEETPAATLAHASKTLGAISLSTRKLQTLTDALVDVTFEMESPERSRIVPTGLRHLDAIIGGWQPTLCVIGAQPGVGKSALLASTVRAMAASGIKVGVFSLEDEARWLAWRLLAHESDVSQYRLRHWRAPPQSAPEHEHAAHNSRVRRVESACQVLQSYADRVLLDDRSGISPQELVLTARDMILNRGVGAIVVDHLGELRFEGRHRERYDLDLMEGLSDLREIAKRHRVPVIVAAHLRRREGLKPGSQPVLSDFANSAAIERQARLALGLAREAESDTLQVHVLKQTNGRAGVTVDLRFEGLAAMVRDCEGEPQNYYPDPEEGR